MRAKVDVSPLVKVIILFETEAVVSKLPVSVEEPPNPLLTAEDEMKVSLINDAVLAKEDDIDEVINPKSSN